MGRRNVTFRVRETPAKAQKPGLAIGARAHVVVMSLSGGEYMSSLAGGEKGRVCEY